MENNKNAMIQQRRKAREEAFQLVFEGMFCDDSAKDIIEAAREARDAEPAPFTQKLVIGVYENVEAIDEIIEKNMKTWKKNRISKVSLALLRIAVYEMLYLDKIPVSVSINEAVELCKVYGGADDPSFVNGVLGGVARSLEQKTDTDGGKE